MKSNGGKLEKARTEVSKAIEMLNEKHTGAELAEARRLLEEAATAISPL